MDYASNSKAHFNYEILETIEAGLVLTGSEVRSIRTGKISIKGSYVKIINGQAYLIGAVIPPYQPANAPEGYDEQASRKLLLSKKELATLIGLAQSHGLTLVPLKIYDKKGPARSYSADRQQKGRTSGGASHLKLLVGIAKGKKKYDKRESIKKKDVARAKQRGMSED